MDRHYLAVDLGAESGRVVLGTLNHESGEEPEGRIKVEEIHRFANNPVSIGGTLRWDVIHLFSEVKIGLRKAAGRGLPISGVSADAWGLDYVFLGGGEPLLSLPFHYRDPRTDTAMERVFLKVSAADIFSETGIQFMSINTLYQLFTDLESRPELLQWADGFLNIGDYFNYLLSGTNKGETTLAGTTQLFDTRKGDWAWNLIGKLGLPRNIFPPLVQPGTPLGHLLPGVAIDTGLKDVQVIATCSHDTAAAVAAVPAVSGEGDWAFLSSGTWSLLGTELSAPLINADSHKCNFTNEPGFAQTTLFRKNIVGLWIVQECRRAWAAEGHEYDYDELTSMAETAPPLVSLIRPDDPRFGKPGHMPAKINDFCRETGQPVPKGHGATIRCALESLALLYAKTLDECAALTGREFRTLHVVGGGSKNKLLNQFTADATGLKVLAGPVEATAIGNVLIQAKTLGHLKGGLRSVVRHSFALETFHPGDAGAWHAAAKRFQALPV